MNYLKVYNNIINNGLHRVLIKEHGYEIHHILAKSLGGSDDVANLVKLTYREHFVVHLLLTKIYPKSAAMLYSAWKFTYSEDGHNKATNSRTHKILKEKYIKSVTIFLDETKLREYFLNPNATKNAAADHFKCNWGTIHKNMGYYNINYLWDGTYVNKLSLDEITDLLSEYNNHTLNEISELTGIVYSKINAAVNEFGLNDKRKRYVRGERLLLEYINSGANFIPRHKLFKEFKMHPRKVTKILEENNVKYVDSATLELNKLTSAIIEVFNAAPMGYSLGGFEKSLCVDARTLNKILSKNNIKYNFNYKQHKGEEYNDTFGKLIERGINSSIFKKRGRINIQNT